MNTPRPHEHVTDQGRQTQVGPEAAPFPSPLAVHGDPSRPDTPHGAVVTANGEWSRQLAWTRPADLSTVVGRELLARTVEVQSAFAKGAWHAPVKVVHATRDRIATHQPSSVAIAPPHREPVTRVVDDGVDPLESIEACVDGVDDEGVQLA